MQRPFSLFIALRMFRSKHDNTFLSFISWICILGLILGVASLIVVTSVLNGFEQTLQNKILGMVPHVTIQARQPIKDWQQLSQQIQNNDPNVQAVAPFVRARGMTSINGNIHGTIINGIDPRQQKKVSVINDLMVEGSLASLTSGSNNIILGKTLVKNNNLQLGDPVSIFIANPSQDDNSIIKPKLTTFTLTGIFSATDKVDNWISYVAMDDASQFLAIESGVRGLRLQLYDIMQSQRSLNQAMNTLNGNGEHYSYRHWQQTHGSLYQSIAMQKTTTSLLLLLIILVAGFNIISALVMLVSEKNNDIAILKTYGATPRLIARIFINQGLIVGMIGIAIGTTLGVIISLSLETASTWLNNQFNLALFDNYYVNALVTKINILDIFLIDIVTICISLLATLYPAYTASKVTPALVLSSN